MSIIGRSGAKWDAFNGCVKYIIILCFFWNLRGTVAEYETPGGERMLPLLLNQTLRGELMRHLAEDSRPRK